MYNYCGAENIRFELGFGDINRVTDGFFGCFNDCDFSKLFPPFGALNPYKTENFIKYSDKVDIASSDGERFFTILAEPNSPINIQSGILPVKTLHFDSAHVKTMENLPLSAEIAPILSNDEEINIPIDIEADYKWHVYHLDEQKYTESKFVPPIVSFDKTILMDGFIIKE
jgi:hypothetical protein